MARELISLDTNHLIRVLVPGTAEAAQVALWLGQGASLTCSSIVWYEFLCGPMGETEMAIAQDLLSGGIMPFGSKETVTASKLYNATGRKRHLRIDSMIAASSIVQGSFFATCNIDDFQLFVPFGLRLKNDRKVAQ